MPLNRAGLILLLLAACREGSDGTDSLPAPFVTNLGVPVVDLTGEGDLWLLSVSEAEAGGQDLNGDGDTLDVVAQALDLASGAIRNLGHALTLGPIPIWRVGAGLAAFGVREESEGRDLNGDGDLHDHEAFLYDFATGTVRDLGISCIAIQHLHEGFAVLLVDEADEGVDLDGDGHLFSQLSYSVDLASGAILPLGTRQLYSALGPWLVIQHHEVEAQADLNGDGDLIDGVAFLYHLPTHTETNLGVDLHRGIFTGEDRFVMSVSEVAQGDRDLNGDGDALDYVVFVLDPATGTLVNTGLGGHGSNFDSPAGARLGDTLLLFTDESDGRDRNQDGDLDDVLPVLYPRAGGRILEPGVAVSPYGTGASPVGGELVIAVDEGQENLDLNEDGDLNDTLVHVFEPATERLRNLAHTTVFGVPATPSRWIETGASEPSEDIDWNGDGDEDDYVPRFLDVVDGTELSTRMATTGPAKARFGDQALFVTQDSSLPLHGLSYSLFDISAQVERPLGLRARFGSRVRSAGEAGALFTVGEPEQGEDLNGDGDALDDVLFRLE